MIEYMKIRILAVCITVFAVVAACNFACAGAESSGARASGFNGPINYAVGKGADGLDIGDINNDGDNELVVANRLTTNLSVFGQTGIPGNPLQKYQEPSLGWCPAVVAIADINRDGINDVAVAHYQEYFSGGRGLTDTFGVCYQNATTHLLDPEISYTFSSGESCRGIAAGDVNSDGSPEIVTANENYGGKIFVWGWNTTDKTLKQIGDYSSINPTVVSVAIGDVTGDGKNDVVLYGSSMYVFKQVAGGALSGPTAYSGTGGETGAIGDVNGDGLDDVAGSTAFSGKMDVWLQDSSTHNLQKDAYSPYDCGGYTEDCHVADMNNDGVADVLIASRDLSQAYIFHQNKTTHTLDSPVIYSTIANRWINELASGDLDGDGITDFAASNWGYMGVDNPNPAFTFVSVWIQNGTNVPEIAPFSAAIVMGTALLFIAAAWKKSMAE
jgi:hypothetical protein